MVTRGSAWPSGTPCWVDLGVADIPRAGRFYSQLFGWQLQAGPPEAGGYTVCLQAGHPVAGIGPQLSPESPPGWAVYLASDDADTTASAIAAAGGEMLIAPRDVLDAGRMALATDPGGAVFGIWQARSHTGFGLANEPGAVCWNENFSRDLAGNQAFYQQVFGYDFGALPDPDFRYATLKLAGTEVGGIGELGSGFPPEVRPTGERISPLPTPTRRWQPSLRRAVRSSGRPGTPPTAGWPWSATTRAPSSR